MAFDYSWVSDKKREAMVRKLQRRGLPQYRQLPISEKYGVSNTGLGPDGTLQKDAVAGFDGNGMYHEGETKVTTPEGSAYVTADMSKLAGMPGFRTGGYSVDRSRGVPSPGAQYATPEQGLPPKQPVSISTQAVQNNMAPSQTSVRPMEAPPVLQAPELTRQEPPVRLAGQPSTINTKPIEAPTLQTVAPTREAITAPTVKVRPIPEQATTTPQVTTPQTTTPVVPTEQPTAEDSARLAGMDYLQSSLTGKSPTEMQGQKALNDLTLRHQQERSAARQRAMQAGATPEEAQMADAQLRASQEAERNNLAAQYGIAVGGEKIGLANTLASQGLAGQEFEQMKQQYGDSQDWKAFEVALETGDSAAASSAFQSATGKTLSQDALNSYTNYFKEKRTQDITQGNLTLDNMRLDLGNEKFQSVMDRINSGASLSQINSELGTAINQSQYNNMLSATALGERDWSRKLTAANMLLATEGATNKNSAAQAYSELFPGTSFDFSSIITDENNKNFGAGMAEMSDYITANMNPEDAMLAMEKSGALTKMGLTKDQATQVYNGMKVNAIDAQWEEMATSDFFKKLSTEDQTDMREFFRQSMSGGLDYDTLKEYELYDTSGKLITTVYGKDATEADKYAKTNGYTVKDTGKVKFQMASTINTVPEAETDTTTDAYNEFLNDVPGGKSVTYDQWQKANEVSGKTINKYSDYQEAIKTSPVIALNDIKDTGSDLLKADNRSKIYEVWENEPEELKKTDYYQNMPTATELSGGISTKWVDTWIDPKRRTTVDSRISSALDASIGKMVELPMKGGVASGMVKGWSSGPSSVSIILVDKSGKEHSYPIYTNPHELGKDNTIYGTKVN